MILNSRSDDWVEDRTASQPLARSQRRSNLEADGIDADDDGLEEGES